jgi:hypothetical protein
MNLKRYNADIPKTEREEEHQESQKRQQDSCKA